MTNKKVLAFPATTNATTPVTSDVATTVTNHVTTPVMTDVVTDNPIPSSSVRTDDNYDDFFSPPPSHQTPLPLPGTLSFIVPIAPQQTHLHSLQGAHTLKMTLLYFVPVLSSTLNQRNLTIL